MATQNKAASAATAPAPKSAAPAAAATPSESKPLVLVVLKKDLKFKGARQAWYDRLCKMDGKTKEEVLADLEKNRPSVYGSKSRHAGKPEPVPGWVRFYERNQYIAFQPKQ